MSEKDRYNPENLSKKGQPKKDPVRELGKAAIKSPDKRAVGDAAIRGANKK